MQEPSAPSQGARDGFSPRSSPRKQDHGDARSPRRGPRVAAARRGSAGSQGRARLLLAGATLVASLLVLVLWSLSRGPDPGQERRQEPPAVDLRTGQLPLRTQEGGPDRTQVPNATPHPGLAETSEQASPAGVRTGASRSEPAAFQLEVTVRPWQDSTARGEVVIHAAGASHEAALAADDLDGSGRCRLEGLTMPEGTPLECTLRMPGLAQVGRTFEAPRPGSSVQLTLDASPAEPHAVHLIEEGSGAAVPDTEVVAFWSAGGRRVRARARTNAQGWAPFWSLPSEPVWFEVRTGSWSSPVVARTHGGPRPVGANLHARAGAPGREDLIAPTDEAGHASDASSGLGAQDLPSTVLLARPAASLFGRLLGVQGQALDPAPSGLRVRALDDLGREHHLRAEVTGEGVYRVEGLPTGALQLLAIAEPNHATSAPLALHLAPGEAHERDLVLLDRVGVRGRVVSAVSGLPLAGAQVEAHLMVGGAWLPEAMPAVSTDAWGRFEGLSVSTTAGAVLARAQGHDQRAARVEVAGVLGEANPSLGGDLAQGERHLGAPENGRQEEGSLKTRLLRSGGFGDGEHGRSRGSLGLGRARREPAPALLDLGDLSLALQQTATLQLSPCPPDAEDWVLLQEPRLAFDREGALVLAASPGPLQVLVQGPGRVPTLVECTLSGAGPWHLEVPAEPADGRLARFHLVDPSGAPFREASPVSTALRIAHLDRATGVAVVQHARPAAEGSALIETRGLPRELMTITLVHAGREGAPQVVDGRAGGTLEVSVRAEVAQDEVLLVDGDGSPLADFDAWLRPAPLAPPHHCMLDGAGRLHLDLEAPLEHLLLADPVSRRLARLDSVRPLAEGPTEVAIPDRLQVALRSAAGPLAHAPLLIGLDPHPAIGALALVSDEEGLAPIVGHGAGPLWLHLPGPDIWRPARRLDLSPRSGGVLEVRVLRTAAMLVRALPRPGGVVVSGAGLVPRLRHLDLQQSASEWAGEGWSPRLGETDAAGELLVRGVPEGPYLLELGGASTEVELRHGHPLEVEVLLP